MNPGGISRDRTHDNVGSALRLAPRNYLLKCWPTLHSASAICQNFRLSILLFILSGFCLRKLISAAIFYVHPSFQILVWQFALWPQFSDGPEARPWFLFFSAFSYCKERGDSLCGLQMAELKLQVTHCASNMYVNNGQSYWEYFQCLFAICIWWSICFNLLFVF